MTIRVLLVDDDSLVRTGLRLMFSGLSDLDIVGEAADGSEVLPLVGEHAPDVVLMDIRMPQVDGLAATEELRLGPQPPEIIVLTTFDADQHVLRALRAGAAGFLLKDTPPEEIVAAVRKVSRGDPVLSPSATRALMRHVGDSMPDDRRSRARGALETLGRREREVAYAVGRGSSNAQIAQALHLSVPTVKTYVSRILTKLDLNNRVQIALLTYDAGEPHD